MKVPGCDLPRQAAQGPKCLQDAQMGVPMPYRRQTQEGGRAEMDVAALDCD